MTRPEPLTKVAPSLTPLQAILASGRARREARKWPWAWWCTVCPDGYGADRTEELAWAQADRHEQTARHLLAADAAAPGGDR